MRKFIVVVLLLSTMGCCAIDIISTTALVDVAITEWKMEGTEDQEFNLSDLYE